LENRVNTLEEKLKIAKIDFENLEIIYKNSSCNCAKTSKSTSCENCEVLQEKIKYLIKIVAKFSRDTTNLNALFGSQNRV